MKSRFKPHLWMISVISHIVPRRLRSDWRQEWEAELHHHEAVGRRDLLRRSSSSFWDAIWLQPRRLEDEMFQDLRYGLRMLLQNKTWTVVAILSLALGIGANTALFSVVDALMIKPLPVRNPEELVRFDWMSGRRMPLNGISGNTGINRERNEYSSSSFSYLTFERFQSQSQTLAEVFAFHPVDRLNVNVNGEAEIATGQLVSRNYFQATGVGTMLGRTLGPNDDEPDSTPVTVLGYRYWQRRFNADPDVVGKPITVNNRIFIVVGVTHREFYGTYAPGTAPDLSFTMIHAPKLINSNWVHEPWNWWLLIVGRLKPGVAVEQAQAQLESVFQQSAMDGWNVRPLNPNAAPEDLEPRDNPRLNAVSGSHGFTDSHFAGGPFYILTVVFALVLLIVCANVANLLSARSASREREIAVRLSLGASRLRLLRQLMTESLLLALCGAALGLLFAYWGKEMLIAVHENPNVRVDLDLQLDVRAIVFTFVITAFTSVLFGLLPALRATRIKLAPSIKDGGRNLSVSRSRLSKTLLIAQVAMSVVLLVGAGLFVRTARNLYTMDFGFNTENLLQFRVNPQLLGYEQQRVRELYEQLLSRIRAVPGVRGVTMSPGPLLTGSSEIGPLFVEGKPTAAGEEPRIHRVSAGPDYFRTLETPIVLGRPLAETDNEGSSKVVVINEALAQQAFPNENPIGRRIGLVAAKPAEFEIVGVVKNFRHWDLREEGPGSVFVPYLQRPLRAMSFKVRTTDDPLALVPSIRAAVREVDSNIPVFDVKTQIQQLEQTMQRELLFARASSFFGGLALLLSCIGLYGLMSYTVARRTQEIGVRMALGAPRREVINMIMRETLLMVFIGVGIGGFAAIALSRGVAAMLYGLTPHDPFTIAAAITLMIVVAGIAGYIPARRASRVDPMVALRCE